MGLVAIINGFEFVDVLEEVLIEPLELGELRHAEHLLPNAGPFVLRDPISGIGWNLDLSGRTSQ